jgi:dihydrofolate synthase / folylpolyglutamate synthase
LPSGGRPSKAPTEWSYYVAVDEIYHPKWAARQYAKFNVIRQAVAHFWPAPEGYPVRLIQVAGTSGKGSTCQFIQTGLSAYGRAGCYVKPHVFDYAERFVVGNSQVEHEEIVTTWEEDVKPYCVESAARGEAWLLDHFEVSLLVALKIFERHHLDWAVIETGLGGRYDPATALEVVATVVTNVGQDHEDVLGGEHWQRALEKAGVCRPGVPLFTGDPDGRSTSVLAGVCKEARAPFLRVSRKEVEALRAAADKFGRKAAKEELLSSEYQLLNAALAAKVVFSLVPRAKLEVLAGSFMKAKYVGRFWKFEADVYADVAHNPSKTKALADDLKRRFPNSKLVLVIGITGTRDPVAVIGPLVAQAKAIVVTAAGFKGQDPERVYVRLRDAYPEVPIHLAPNPATTLSVAKNLRSPGEKVVFTGSTYMIDQALNWDEKLRHLNASVGWREVRQKQIAGTLNFAIPERS